MEEQSCFDDVTNQSFSAITDQYVTELILPMPLSMNDDQQQHLNDITNESANSFNNNTSATDAPPTTEMNREVDQQQHQQYIKSFAQLEQENERGLLLLQQQLSSSLLEGRFEINDDLAQKYADGSVDSITFNYLEYLFGEAQQHQQIWNGEQFTTPSLADSFIHNSVETSQTNDDQQQEMLMMSFSAEQQEQPHDGFSNTEQQQMMEMSIPAEQSNALPKTTAVRRSRRTGITKISQKKMNPPLSEDQIRNVQDTIEILKPRLGCKIWFFGDTRLVGSIVVVEQASSIYYPLAIRLQYPLGQPLFWANFSSAGRQAYNDHARLLKLETGQDIPFLSSQYGASSGPKDWKYTATDGQVRLVTDFLTLEVRTGRKSLRSLFSTESQLHAFLPPLNIATTTQYIPPVINELKCSAFQSIQHLCNLLPHMAEDLLELDTTPEGQKLNQNTLIVKPRSSIGVNTNTYSNSSSSSSSTTNSSSKTLHKKTNKKRKTIGTKRRRKNTTEIAKNKKILIPNSSPLPSPRPIAPITHDLNSSLDQQQPVLDQNDNINKYKKRKRLIAQEDEDEDQDQHEDQLHLNMIEHHQNLHDDDSASADPEYKFINLAKFSGPVALYPFNIDDHQLLSDRKCIKCNTTFQCKAQNNIMYNLVTPHSSSLHHHHHNALLPPSEGFVCPNNPAEHAFCYSCLLHQIFSLPQPLFYPLFCPATFERQKTLLPNGQLTSIQHYHDLITCDFPLRPEFIFYVIDHCNFCPSPTTTTPTTTVNQYALSQSIPNSPPPPVPLPFVIDDPQTPETIVSSSSSSSSTSVHINSQQHHNLLNDHSYLRHLLKKRVDDAARIAYYHQRARNTHTSAATPSSSPSASSNNNNASVNNKKPPYYYLVYCPHSTITLVTTTTNTNTTLASTSATPQLQTKQLPSCCYTATLYDRRTQPVPVVATCSNHQCRRLFCTGCYSPLSSEDHPQIILQHQTQCKKWFHTIYTHNLPNLILSTLSPSQTQSIIPLPTSTIDDEQTFIFQIIELITFYIDNATSSSCPCCRRRYNLYELYFSNSTTTNSDTLSSSSKLTTHITWCPCGVHWCYLCGRILPRSSAQVSLIRQHYNNNHHHHNKSTSSSASTSANAIIAPPFHIAPSSSSTTNSDHIPILATSTPITYYDPCKHNDFGIETWKQFFSSPSSSQTKRRTQSASSNRNSNFPDQCPLFFHSIHQAVPQSPPNDQHALLYWHSVQMNASPLPKILHALYNGPTSRKDSIFSLLPNHFHTYLAHLTSNAVKFITTTPASQPTTPSLTSSSYLS